MFTFVLLLTMLDTPNLGSGCCVLYWLVGTPYWHGSREGGGGHGKVGAENHCSVLELGTVYAMRRCSRNVVFMVVLI